MSVHNGMTIGVLAGATGCTVPTIRYYEEIGLLPEALRRMSGHRVYNDGDLRRLTFIRRCRDFGFPIEQIRELVALVRSPERDCTAARDLAQQNLVEVRRKLKELRALERSLKSFVSDCNLRCAGGPASACVILEDLAASRPSPCCEGARTAERAAGRCCEQSKQTLINSRRGRAEQAGAERSRTNKRRSNRLAKA
jgi:DNA-binding transcriptional MerR regulator